MEPTNVLKRTLKTSTASAPEKGYVGGNLEQITAACVSELMNAATTFHKLHLKVTGTGSYAAHKALNEAYDAFGDHADSLVEEYQGAEEKIIELPNTAPAELNSVEDGLEHLRKLKDKINSLQSIMPHSEIVNLLDEAKSTINGVKYKLLFLK